MPSQSINTKIIKCPDTITQSTPSKTFALLLIEDHEMIDNFSGIDTVGGGHYSFCRRGQAAMILFFLKGQVKSPMLHNTRDGSEFYVPYISHYM